AAKTQKESAFETIPMVKIKQLAKARCLDMIPPGKPLSKTTIQQFDEFVQLCKKRNIEIIGIRYPVSPWYAEHISPEIKFKTDSILQSYRIPVQDYLLRYGDTLRFYSNNDHLSKVSAPLFTNEVMQKLGLE
ncbi:MAG: hypothetical protein NZ108_07305, partial [Bacteroidia bacterium]|nr:hypothetical protein [Bacteroidia bacterium]